MGLNHMQRLNEKLLIGFDYMNLVSINLHRELKRYLILDTEPNYTYKSIAFLLDLTQLIINLI